MEGLKGLYGSSKKIAQAIAEQQKTQLWDLWSPAVLAESDKSDTYIIPNFI